MIKIQKYPKNVKRTKSTKKLYGASYQYKKAKQSKTTKVQKKKSTKIKKRKICKQMQKMKKELKVQK